MPCRTHPEIPLLGGGMRFCWCTILEDLKKSWGKNNNKNFENVVVCFFTFLYKCLLSRKMYSFCSWLRIFSLACWIHNSYEQTNKNQQAPSPGWCIPSKRTRGLSKNISLQEVNGCILVELRPQTRRQAERQSSPSLQGKETHKQLNTFPTFSMHHILPGSAETQKSQNTS